MMMPKTKIDVFRATLQQQFGRSARSIIDAEVDSALVGDVSKKLVREDLDAIERGVVSALRSRRASTGQHCLSPSRGLISSHSRGSRPSGGLISSYSRSDRPMSSSTSAPQLADDKAPPRCLVKQPDHFDLMAAFADEEVKKADAAQKAKKKDEVAEIRAGLGRQLAERRAQAESEEADRHKTREAMLAKVAEFEQEEASAKRRQAQAKQELKRVSDKAMERLAQNKDRQEKERQRESEELDAVIAADQRYEEHQAKLRRTAFLARAKDAREGFEAAAVTKKLKREMEVKADQEMAIEVKRQSEIREANANLTYRKLQEMVDKRVSTVGVQNAAVASERVRVEEDRVDKNCEERLRKETEELLRRDRQRAQWTLETASANRSISATMSQCRSAIDPEEADRLRTWREQDDKFNKTMKEKSSKLRQTRSDFDAANLRTMRQNAMVHYSEAGITDVCKAREVGYNRPILEKIKKEGFCPELTQTILTRADRSSAQKRRARPAC